MDRWNKAISAARHARKRRRRGRDGGRHSTPPSPQCKATASPPTRSPSRAWRAAAKRPRLTRRANQAANVLTQIDAQYCNPHDPLLSEQPTSLQRRKKGRAIPRSSFFCDAEGIAEAATRPTMRFVELKSQEQLDMQTLHRSRDRLVGERTALINQLRAILLERGFVAPQGKRKLEQFLVDLMDEQGGPGLSPRIIMLITDACTQWAELDRRIAAFDAEFIRWTKESATSTSSRSCRPRRGSARDLLKFSSTMMAHGRVATTGERIAHAA
jgi:hypothetical protein